MASHSHASLENDLTQLRPGNKGLGIGLMAIGAVALVGAAVVAYATHHGERFYSSLLFGVGVPLMISCAALLFVLIGHLVRAGWVVNVRRVMESFAMQLPLLAILLLPVIVVSMLTMTSEHDGHKQPFVYSWAVPSDTPLATHHVDLSHEIHYPNEQVKPGVARHYDGIIAEKRHGWLNPIPWGLRQIAYFVILSGVAWYFYSRSVRQDTTGDADISLHLLKIAGPVLMACGLIVTFIAFDMYMSLDPHWFSTMYGVYFFASGTQAMWATMCLSFILLQKRGYLKQSVTPEHYHDMGKWLWAFVVFWTYIAFSQYMLQWYANMPEETFWYDKRGYSTAHPNGYSPLVIALLICRFCIPFLGLVSRHVKRNKFGLGFWSVWLLACFVLDVYLLVLPEFHWANSFSELPLGLVEILCLVGGVSLWVGNTIRLLASHALRPVHDPRTHESLAISNI